MHIINPIKFVIDSEKKNIKRRTGLHKAMMRREAELGGKLFGPETAERYREFFCLDNSTWVWHEEWVDAEGKWQRKTTRYDVKTDGVYKAQQGAAYKKISDSEAINLYKAVELYGVNVSEPLYGYTKKEL